MQNSRKHDFASFPCKKDTMVGKHSTTELHPSPKALCCLNLKEKTPNNVPPFLLQGGERTHWQSGVGWTDAVVRELQADDSWGVGSWLR
jgi:hypothetical protein